MTNEIFYLESCLAIEKSMEAVRESVRYAYNDFMFESPKDVFETIKRKILELIQKVKEIFNSVVMKKKNAETVKKAKTVKNGKIKIRNHKKLFKLYDNCRKDLRSKKDPKKVKDKWKKGLVILGFVATTAGIAGYNIKQYRDTVVRCDDVKNTLESFRENMRQKSKDLESDVDKLERDAARAERTKRYTDSIINTIHVEVDSKTKEQASTMSEMYSDLSKSTSELCKDIYSGTDEMVKNAETTKNMSGASMKSFSDVWEEENDRYMKTVRDALDQNMKRMSDELSANADNIRAKSKQDTIDKLRDLGYSDSEIDEMLPNYR